MTHFNLQSRQSYETVPTEPCGSPISFPILDLQPPVYSDNGELLIPSGEETVVGYDAASQPTDTNESTTNRTDHSMPDIEGSSSGSSTASSTDLSIDRTVENGSTAPDRLRFPTTFGRGRIAAPRIS